jgi:hypothetical protein
MDSMRPDAVDETVEHDHPDRVGRLFANLCGALANPDS